jgi:hypothetical protein
MTLVSTVTVGAGGAASISFTGIPGSATDLVLLVSLRSTDESASSQISFNSDTNNANYSRILLNGNGSAVSSAGGNNRGFFYSDLSSFTSNTFSNGQLYVPNYSGSTNKSASIDTASENNATLAYAGIQAVTWANTSAITSITLTTSLGGNFAQYSTASLYTITKGSGGATVA